MGEENKKEFLEEFFVIARLSRDDFRAIGFNADALSDADMQDIADTMGDSFVSEQFWTDLHFFAEQRNLKAIPLL